MAQGEFVIRERLGAAYERSLVRLDLPGATAVKDLISGRILPVQTVPSTALDAADVVAEDRTSRKTDETPPEVPLVLVDIAPGEEMRLAPTDEPPSAAADPILVSMERQHWVVTNGRRAVRMPRDGFLEPAFPGPIDGFRLDGGNWFGRSALVDAPCRGSVMTRIESLGPCCIQWRTTYRWGGDGGFSILVRWANRSDTLLVVEEVFKSSDARVEWFPLWEGRARAHSMGGGERLGPMQPIQASSLPEARRAAGRRILGRVGHISYSGRWNLPWVGFSAGDGRFAGLFPGWGASWRRRGAVRPEIVEDDSAGHFVRFPIREGMRLYGLLVCTSAESGLESATQRCLLNRRKAQLSDLRLNKVLTWDLDPPAEPRRPHLARREDLDVFRDRLAADPGIGAALEEYLQTAGSEAPGRLAAALWKNDRAAMRACVPELLHFAEKTLRDVADGGYERLGVNDGRAAKRLAWDLDILWALDAIAQDEYRRVRAAFLAMAYAFSDQDYCRHGDFWPKEEKNEGIASALEDDVGQCPVPPNVLSEFFTATGVMAELFPLHPMASRWRRGAMRLLDRFIETFFEPDGTYHEAASYHDHALNEMLCLLYPWYANGERDYFAHPQIAGSFLHFVEIQMPPLVDGVRPLVSAVPADPRGVAVSAYAGWNQPRLAPIPADGESGGDGLEQEIGGHLALGAYVYKDRDPALASALMHAWKAAGKRILGLEHPVLTLLTLDPTIPSAEYPYESCWRASLGVISKARKPGGAPVWCLLRAGKATHHMDFDQGNIHLAAWDSSLLGDHGRHTHDTSGKPLPAASTWLHNTVVYAEDRNLSSGYTGLDRAPDPLLVHLGRDFDWCVHRIVNTNFRDLSRLRRTELLPAPRTIHIRHYLFVKPDYFLVWDTFEEAHRPSVFRLHLRYPLTDLGGGAFLAAEPEPPDAQDGKARRRKPRLRIQFLLPQSPEIVQDCQVGPLWCLGVRNGMGEPYMALLIPQLEDAAVEASWDPGRNALAVSGPGMKDLIFLPPPGSTTLVPRIERRG